MGGKETACSSPPESLSLSLSLSLSFSLAKSAVTEIVQADLSKNGAFAKYAYITDLHSRSWVVQVFLFRIFYLSEHLMALERDRQRERESEDCIVVCCFAFAVAVPCMLQCPSSEFLECKWLQDA